MPLAKFIQWQTTAGQPMTVGNMRVTPLAQALTLRFPYGGCVWNRPSALLVERDGQPPQRILIVDVTRLAMLLLLCSAIVGVMLFKKEQNS